MLERLQDYGSSGTTLRSFFYDMTCLKSQFSAIFTARHATSTSFTTMYKRATLQDIEQYNSVAWGKP